MLHCIARVLMLISWTLLIPSVFSLEATYYSDGFEGSITANGTTFSQNSFSAALCEIELGQYGYLRYGGSGAVVILNDRPNCQKHQNVVDLSRSAFEVFSPTSAGRLYNVDLTILGKSGIQKEKKIFPRDIYGSLGVQLTNSLSNTYFTEDQILLRGKVEPQKKYALIYLEEKTTKKKILTELAQADKNGNFSYLLSLPSVPGEYFLILAGGKSFETTLAPVIHLIKESTLVYPTIGNENRSSVSNFSPTINAGIIKLPQNYWVSLHIEQDGTSFTAHGIGGISIQEALLHRGIASVFMSGYQLSTPSSLDRGLSVSNFYSGVVFLDRTREIYGIEKISTKITKQNATIRVKLKPQEKVRSIYYVTLPNGDVRAYEASKSYINVDGFLKTGTTIVFSFPMKENGVYKFELVQSDGFAYVNVPIYQGKVWGIVRNMSESDKTTIRSNTGLIQLSTLTSINSIRAALGRNLLISDDTLAVLAQAKAEDMAKYNYVGHVTKNGKDILEFARSLGLRLSGSVGENVAGGNVSDLFLQDGLEESGSHRFNIVNPLWTKVGIGYVSRNQNTYLVHIFGE